MAVPGQGGEAHSPGEVRASHQDRDKIVEVLQTAASDGRLTAEEFEERLDAALTARTHGELVRLTTDLPAVPGGVLAGPPPEPKDVVRIDCRSASTGRDGRWVVPRRIEVRVTSGSVKLDFTEAVITQPTLHIDADVSSGSLTLVTKPGIHVDTDEVSVRSGTVRVRHPEGSDVPVMLRIDVAGRVGSGMLTARPRKPPRPPRRTFLQWLLRRPRPPAITA